MLPAVAVAVVLVAKVAVVIVVLGTRGFALTLRLQDRACRAFGVLRMGVLVSRVKRIWGLCAFTRDFEDWILVCCGENELRVMGVSLGWAARRVLDA